jgi:hypothetical protein
VACRGPTETLTYSRCGDEFRVLAEAPAAFEDDPNKWA